MRRVKLSESQRDEIVKRIQEMMSENLNPNNNITIKKTVETESDKNNPINTLASVERTARGLGINTNNPDIKTSVVAKIGGQDKELTASSDSNSISESVLITKQQLMEMKLRNLKKGSKVIKVKNIVK